jgi:hypothetical protein
MSDFASRFAPSGHACCAACGSGQTAGVAPVHACASCGGVTVMGLTVPLASAGAWAAMIGVTLCGVVIARRIVTAWRRRPILLPGR